MYKILDCKIGKWKIVPEGALSLDLSKVKKRFDVVLDGGIAVVVKDSLGQFIIKKTGEVRFKKERSKEEVAKVAEEVYACV